MINHKVYLGDGVYAWFDGYQIWLETMRENTTHEIALEPDVMAVLDAYRARLNEFIKQKRAAS
jgi:hypothetical protein